jgi:hypothetical protein
MLASLGRQKAVGSCDFSPTNRVDDSAFRVVEGAREEEFCAVERACMCVFLLAGEPREDAWLAEGVAAFEEREGWVRGAVA